jgi:hypothetical protein
MDLGSLDEDAYVLHHEVDGESPFLLVTLNSIL